MLTSARNLDLIIDKFCAEVSTKSSSIKAIYIYARGRPYYALLANGIVYYAMTYCFGDISI